MKTRIIRFRDVQTKTGLSRPTIWRLERAGRFPNRIQVSAKAVGWLLAEIDAWLEERAGRELPDEKAPSTDLNSKKG